LASITISRMRRARVPVAAQLAGLDLGLGLDGAHGRRAIFRRPPDVIRRDRSLTTRMSLPADRDGRGARERPVVALSSMPMTCQWSPILAATATRTPRCVASATRAPLLPSGTVARDRLGDDALAVHAGA